jgi:hypothetical protein
MEMDAEKRDRDIRCAKMSDILSTVEREDAPMHEREIELSDGRYMIFYTFGDEAASDDQGEDV